jgi:hypothetical protein
MYYNSGPDPGGLGNILMRLCYVDTVNKSFYDHGRGDFFKLTNIHVVEEVIPPLYIIPEIHSRISQLVEPTDTAKIYIEKYKHLVEGVSCAIQVRMSERSSNCIVRKGSRHTEFCDDSGLEKFKNIVASSEREVFMSSDCLATKRLFREIFGSKIKFIDEECQYMDCNNKDFPWVTCTDFFLLGMCPIVYMTGGHQTTNSFSTFGYMAALYGRKPCNPIFNDPLPVAVEPSAE